MNKRHGFTLLELAAVCLLIALVLYGLVRPMQRRQARSMQNSVHLAGIHKGMILWPQGSGQNFPGVEANKRESTRPIPAQPGVAYGTNSVRGSDPVYRIALLVRGGYVSTEHLKSPAETNPLKLQPLSTARPMTADDFSYALLRIDNPDDGRRGEWSTTQSPRAAVISDRNLSATAGASATSLHVSPGDSWRGGVVYNDNHVVFETSNIIKTEYSQQGDIVLDDLFADDKDKAGNSGNDAAMVHQDAVTYVNQK